MKSLASLKSEQEDCAHVWVERDSGEGWKYIECEKCEKAGDYGDLYPFDQTKGTA